MRATGSTKIRIPRGAAVAAVVTAITIATSGVAAASAGQSPTPPPGPLTPAQLKQALPTSAEVAGYTFNPAEDTSNLTTTPANLTSGGPSCQKFLDATSGLVSTYGTVAAAQRTLHETTCSGSHDIQVNLMTFNDPTAAGKVITDAKDGIGNCTNVQGTASGSPIVGTVTPIPQLQSATDRVGYFGYLTVGGVALLVAAETVQVGSTVADVELIGPQTQDQTVLEQLGTTLGQVTNTVTGKLGATAA
jgi:PknH-like extracellular domain